jgi:hypothetical protein
MNSKKGIFLGRNGKIEGPFTENDLKRFELSGRMTDYSWIIRHGENAWTLLENPPPLPHFGTSPQPIFLKDMILHDFHQFTEGSLTELSELQALVYCAGVRPDEKFRGFAPGSKVLINLIEPHSKKEMNIETRLSSQVWKNDGLYLCLDWEKIPSLLAA